MRSRNNEALIIWRGADDKRTRSLSSHVCVFAFARAHTACTYNMHCLHCPSVKYTGVVVMQSAHSLCHLARAHGRCHFSCLPLLIANALCCERITAFSLSLSPSRILCRPAGERERERAFILIYRMRQSGFQCFDLFMFYSTVTSKWSTWWKKTECSFVAFSVQTMESQQREKKTESLCVLGVGYWK